MQAGSGDILQERPTDSELDGLGRVIEKLTDRHDVARAGAYETLTLGLVDRR